MKPIWKWIIGILTLIVVVAGGAIWYFTNNWKPIVEEKLKEVVHNSTDGLYSLTYDNLDLNIGLGNVTLHNAELIPDSIVYQKLVQTKEAPNNRFHIKIKDLKIRRFSLFDVLTNRKLNIKTISFDEPEIHLMSEYHSFNDTIAKKQPKTLYESIKDIFTSINVSDIKIDNVKFKYTKLQEGKETSLALDSVNIAVHDVLVDETSVSDSTRFFYTKMVDVQLPGFEYDLPDGYYKAKFDHLRINTREQNVLLTNVVYMPKMSKSAFFKKKGKNVTMAALQFDTLRLEKLDFRQFIDDQQTLSSKVQLKNGRVDLYMDKRYPKRTENKIGHSPHQQLLKLKKLFRVDTLLVDNISVAYHEFSSKFNQEGSISFDHAKGMLTNVTNDQTVLKQNKYMKADLSAKIMGTGNLNVKFTFNMLSKNGEHTYKGTLGSMQATAFNRILRPLLNVEIASGNIKKIAFDMHGTDYKNTGEFRFDYDDLKVNILDKKEPGKAKKSKKLFSFLINEIIINNSNPDLYGKYIIGKVNYTRVKEHSFFKTLWQSLLEGIKQCAGISPEREARFMKTAGFTKNAVNNTKETADKTGGFIKNLFKKKEKKDAAEEKK